MDTVLAPLPETDEEAERLADLAEYEARAEARLLACAALFGAFDNDPPAPRRLLVTIDQTEGRFRGL